MQRHSRLCREQRLSIHARRTSGSNSNPSEELPTPRAMRRRKVAFVQPRVASNAAFGLGTTQAAFRKRSLGRQEPRDLCRDGSRSVAEAAGVVGEARVSAESAVLEIRSLRSGLMGPVGTLRRGSHLGSDRGGCGRRQARYPAPGVSTPHRVCGRFGSLEWSR